MKNLFCIVRKEKRVLVFLFFLFLSTVTFAQKTVTGVVKENGNPVAGASVQVQGANVGTQTNADGLFTITVPAGKSVLVISYVGMETKTVDVSNVTNVEVTLTSATSSMNEVVVTALGITRKKKALGYSVQDLKGDQVNVAKENNLANSLAGKIAGLQVSPTGNGPGGSARIIIRGNNSLGGNNQPLIVVDGIPMENEQTATGQSEYGSFDQGDGISQINPNDIDNISVLKGPAAAALYGNRGGNGVILITTKKGTNSKGLGISFTSNYQIEQPLLYPDMQNQYSQGGLGVYDTLKQGSWGALITGQQVKDWTGQTRALYADPDDLKNFLQTGKSATNTIELSGGNATSNFRLGYTNFENKGLLPTSSVRRNQVVLRMGSQVNKFLTVDAKVSYTNQNGHNRPQTSGSPSNIFSQYTASIPRTVHLSDMLPEKDANGVQRLWFPSAYSTLRNPYWVLYDDFNNDQTDRLLTMVSLNIKLAPWLNLMLRHGMDYRNTLSQQLNAYGIDGGLEKPNFNSSYSEYRDRRVETDADFLLSANKTFNDWSFGLSVGGNRLDEKYHNIGASTGVLDFPGAYNVAFGSLARPYDQSPSIRRVNSIYALGSVGFKDFLFVDGTFRNDWSSTLSPKNRSFNYPSVNASVILNSLWSNVFKGSFPAFINYAKIRAGYAKAGNSIVPYALIPYSSIVRDGRGIPTLSFPQIKPDPDILPELVRSEEAGLELRLFKNRIGFDFTVYKKNAFNQIIVLPDPIAFAQGYIHGAYANGGNIENRGYEFVFTANPLRMKSGLNWDLTVNFNHNVNKIIRLHPDLPQYALQSTENSRAIFITASEGQLYGNLLGRAFVYNDKGRMIVDDDGTPKVSGNKDQLLGNFQPKYLMGILNSVSYKGFSLGFLIDIRHGGQFYSQTLAYMYANGNAKGTLQYREGGLVVDGVHADGTENTTAINSEIYWGKVAGAQPVGGLFTYDASNVRLREATLGYTIPPKLLAKTPVRGIRVDLVGRNLWLIKSHIPGIDPESAFNTTNAQGWENGAYPSVRSYGVNLKIDF